MRAWRSCFLLLLTIHACCAAEDTIWLHGASGNGPFPVVSQWITAFKALYPEAGLTVSSVNSEAAHVALHGEVDCEEQRIESVCGDVHNSTHTIWGIGDAELLDHHDDEEEEGESHSEDGDHDHSEEHSDYNFQSYPAMAGAVVIVFSKDVLNHAGHAHALRLNSTGDDEGDGDGHVHRKRFLTEGHSHGEDEEEESSDDHEHEDEEVHLQLTFDVLAAILNGTIEYWDDDAIREINHDVEDDLPHEPITVVYRDGSSGQTEILTTALQYQVPSWPKEAVGRTPHWPLEDHILPLEEFHLTDVCESEHHDDHNETTEDIFENNDDEPEHERDHYSAHNNDELNAGLLRIPFSLGYLDTGTFIRMKQFVNAAMLSTKKFPDMFIEANEETLHITMEGRAADLDPTTLTSNLADSCVEGGYPASGWAYWYINQSEEAYESCYQAWLLVQFIEWTYTNPQAREIAEGQGWAVPPDSVVNRAVQKFQNILCRTDEGEVVAVTAYTPAPNQIDYNYLGGTRVVCWVLAIIVIVCSLTFMIWVLLNRKERSVKASQPEFLVMVCLGTLIMGAAIFPLGIDDELTSTRGCDIACMSWVWLVPIGFSISFSALFSKIWRLNMLIERAGAFKRLKLRSRDVLKPFVVVFGLNVLLLTLWTIVDPMVWTRELDGPFSSYGFCESKGDAWAYFLVGLVLVNFGALAAAVVQAYKARNLSDEFSESSYIGFALISLLQALLLGLPISILVGDNPSARMFAFSGILFVMSMSLLTLIFIPKIGYIRRKKKESTMETSKSKSSSDSGMRIRGLGADSSLEGSKSENPAEVAASYTSLPTKPYYSGLKSISKSSSNDGSSSKDSQGKAPRKGASLRKSFGSVPSAVLPDIMEASDEPMVTNGSTTEEKQMTGDTMSNLKNTQNESSVASIGEGIESRRPPTRLALVGQAVGMDMEGADQHHHSSSFSTLASSTYGPSDHDHLHQVHHGTHIEDHEHSVRVEDLPPDIANWFFRTGFKH